MKIVSNTILTLTLTAGSVLFCPIIILALTYIYMLSCLFQKKSTLLVFCEEGYVVEIDSPEGATFDTSHTFHITGLPMKQYKFKSIKSRVRVSIHCHSNVAN